MVVYPSGVRTLIHLVRHAEVYNPNNIWYGRLEGFHLSERGLRQADAVGEFLSSNDIVAVHSSPLTRALQTSTAIAKPHSLEVQIEEHLIESETKLQGKPGDRRMFKNPLNARHFINPMRPSWGEPYAHIASRMRRVVEELVAKYAGHEAVAVSHMTPVLVARLEMEGNLKPPWRAGLPCRRGSVTTLEFEDGVYRSTRYEPVGSAIS